VPSLENEDLKNTQKRVGQKNLQDEMNEIKPGRETGPKKASRGLIRGILELWNAWGPGGGGCYLPPVIFTPAHKCLLYGECGPKLEL
jgi:hypothetical protein